jgi:hypothetical protein
VGDPVIQRSFGGGELAPVLHARGDQVKYTQGLRTCRNFLVRREGGASNRAGLRFVAPCKTRAAGTRLMPFLGPTVDESCAIEMGAGYLRWIKDGAPLTVTDVPAFDSGIDYVQGDLVSQAGVNYYCRKSTSGDTTARRLPIDEFDVVTGWVTATATGTKPTLSVVVGHDGGPALRAQRVADVDRYRDPHDRSGGGEWTVDRAHDPYFTMSKGWVSPRDLTLYADSTAITDAAVLAPWLRMKTGPHVNRVRLFVVTADWDGTAVPDVEGTPSVNTSGFYLDLDAAALHIGTSVDGTWFQATNADGAAITRGDWVSWGTPDWATVLGLLIQCYSDTQSCYADFDDLAFVTALTTGRLATPSPSEAAYWYALTGDLYEIPTPYASGSLPTWDQSGNVIVLTHADSPPQELVYQGVTRWILRPASTQPTITRPTAVTGTKGAAGTLTSRYVVSAAKADTYEESFPSDPVEFTLAAAPTETAPNLIAWTAVPAAAEYYVYVDPAGNGTYAYVGTATGVTNFADTGAVPPDFEDTPVQAGPSFAAAGDYPSRCAHYQQRRWYAGSRNQPDAIWGSRTAFPGNFTTSRPLQDDDAITLQISGNLNHPVRWLVGLKPGMVVGTDGGEWTLTGGSGAFSPITPSSIDVRQETYNGVAAEVRPVVVGNTILYLQARGSILRDIQFDQQVQGLAGRDLTVWASHLFERRAVVAVDYQQVPNTIVWAVRDDGTLLGLTYLPDQDVWGWHRHDTAGAFEDVCVVPEDDEDALYVIVSRTVGGATVRHIERLARREIADATINADSFFVDAGLTYQGAAASVFTGLDHLEGQVVAVVGDGVVVFNGDPANGRAASFTVRGGTIRTATRYATVHIGLPIRFPEIETLDLDIQGSAIRDKKKRVGSLTVLLERSARSFMAGPNAASLVSFTVESWDPTDPLYTGQCELRTTSQFDQYGRTLLRVVDPVPVTVLAVIPNVEIGG